MSKEEVITQNLKQKSEFIAFKTKKNCACQMQSLWIKQTAALTWDLQKLEFRIGDVQKQNLLGTDWALAVEGYWSVAVADNCRSMGLSQNAWHPEECDWFKFVIDPLGRLIPGLGVNCYYDQSTIGISFREIKMLFFSWNIFTYCFVFELCMFMSATRLCFSSFKVLL